MKKKHKNTQKSSTKKSKHSSTTSSSVIQNQQIQNQNNVKHNTTTPKHRQQHAGTPLQRAIIAAAEQLKLKTTVINSVEYVQTARLIYIVSGAVSFVNDDFIVVAVYDMNVF